MSRYLKDLLRETAMENYREECAQGLHDVGHIIYHIGVAIRNADAFKYQRDLAKCAAEARFAADLCDYILGVGRDAAEAKK